MLVTVAPSSASSAACQPDPVPTSSARSPGRTSTSSSMWATTSGWEMVWPPPIGSGSFS